MYKNKKDVDKHVENLISKLSAKEFQTRAYSIARLYFDVGDYTNCQRYVEQYLTLKDNNAAAHKLLGHALQRLGQKEKALEQYKTSLDIDPTQTSVILDICELLADDDVTIDPGRAKYWCEKAESKFPRHPITFCLREKLVKVANPDPEALVNLLRAELEIRPKDAVLHTRLLKCYLQINKIEQAISHITNVEFQEHSFLHNYVWYETLADVLKHTPYDTNWLYHLLLLTVKERICALSLTETPSGTSKSLVECNEHLHSYDQAIQIVAKAGVPAGFAEFHASLIQHHQGQFAFYAATLLLKKAKKNQINWRNATNLAAPLMLLAWHTVPINPKVKWLTHAPAEQQNAIHRWYKEGSYRCSQSGHYLLSNIQDKSQSFLDQISQCCSGTHWRDKLYEKIFASKEHLAKIKTSNFTANTSGGPVLRLPRKIEIEAYDADAQRVYPNSLHHFVWMLLNYKNYAQFKCNLFDMLTPKSYNYANCGPETLDKLDVLAFLFSATLTAEQRKSNQTFYDMSDKPHILPANITDLLCTFPQMKWWDCIYKFSQNELGTELTDIRTTLSRGIEVIRCIDNHGLDAEFLCRLGRIFSECAKLTTSVDEKKNLEIRACLYYNAAIPQLEKIKSKIILKFPEQRIFDYTHRELTSKDLNSLIEESKLYVAVSHHNDCEYEKVIDILSSVNSPQAYYYLSDTYQKMASEENNLSKNISVNERKTKVAMLLTKAKSFAYKALDHLKHYKIDKDQSLLSNIQRIIEDVEFKLNGDLSVTENDVDVKYSSDEYISLHEHAPIRTNSRVIRSISSTPKQTSRENNTNYRSALDLEMQNTQVDPQCLERIENQIKNLQKRDITINDFIEQTKNWFEDNRKLGHQIVTMINSNIQNTTDQFKLLKISVDQVKDQIDECRNECKDVSELKKQIAELKKEVNKIKKIASEQTIDDSDLYNLDEEYRTNESTSNFTTQLPFNPPQVIPSFNPRLGIPPFPVPPNAYQLYGQNLYNLYNQYSQFAQSQSIPSAPPMFDSNRPHMNYPGVYPTNDQMYLDIAHLVPSAAATAPAVPPVPTIPTVPVPSVPVSTPSMSIASSVSLPSAGTSARVKPSSIIESKEIPRSLPVNVVITSSDPLPTCTTAPVPILSVTIPPKHIKATPHNYQIAMPTTIETKTTPLSIFNFPTTGNKINASTTNPLTDWNKSSVFNSAQQINTSGDSLNNSRAILDESHSGTTPNTSLINNKSRTLSEKSNTSIENYDPCPDFKPIIPLPAEVKVTTGEEDEGIIFSARAKLFRFVDKQWKERGLGDMKLLKHKVTGKVRVLMRREQIHKVCANHIITHEMEIKPMKNETKAYFWVANDFADETVTLEKFCIRFKTADIGQQFYDTFEKARKETSIIDLSSSKPKGNLNVDCSQLQKENPEQSTDSHPMKTVIGGFTFSSTPTFKSVTQDSKVDNTKAKESAPAKVNVFSSLNLKTTTTSPFCGFLNTTGFVSTSVATQNQETGNKLNSSDTVEEFEPQVEYKPVVPLPALVELKTGEEDENILFEHRAKLLRFEASTKEWKERGLGNIKLLEDKRNLKKVRILMRREQVMKVCCNHSITVDMVFQKMPNMDKAVTWCAKDFSEGYLVPETFCLRFKTVKACDDFIETIKLAQLKMKDTSKAVKEDQNTAIQNKQTGFSDKMKSKQGSWYCNSCYTNNLISFSQCACCEAPRQNDTNEVSKVTPPPIFLGGEKFKPKAGTWECKECLIRNEANAEACCACSSPKEPMSTKKEILVSNSTTVPVVSGWGDKFKPKRGSWNCKTCFISNESDIEVCIACKNPKDPNAVKKETTTSLLNSTLSGPKFNFGIPATVNNNQKPKTDSTSIFDGTGTHKFSFGIPQIIPEKASNIIVVSFSDQNPSLQTSTMFGTSKPSPDNSGSLVFSNKNNDDNKTAAPVKSALLQTPNKENSTPSFVSKESGTFDFVFKSKSPQKGVKSPKSEKGDESDCNEYASEDEGHHIHFNPVVPLPEKIEVITGEENETILYSHRAKLFIFVSGEWKERGIGIVKLLKHNETGKLRVVMRREQVLKMCLNHALTPEITYRPKDKKTWIFAAHDYSEGELNLQSFCLRFQNRVLALEFKSAIDNAREGSSATVIVKHKADKTESDGDDIVFVKEIQATTEEKEKARKLMLPENFYTYTYKQPCQGCRGCEDNETAQSNTTRDNTETIKSLQLKSDIVSTPVKAPTACFQTPINSLYNTPDSSNKSYGTPVFHSPLELTNTSTAPSAKTNDKNDISDAHSNDNTEKTKLFTMFGEQKPIFGTPLSKSVNFFGSNNTQTPVATKKVLAPPKFFSQNTTDTENKSETEPMFGFTQSNSFFGDTKSVFGSIGASSNKSIFNFNSDIKKDDNQKPEIKSIFGGESDQKPVNFFSEPTEGSIFGPLSNPTKLFGNASNQSSMWTFNAGTNQKKPDVAVTNVPTVKKVEDAKADNPPPKDTIVLNVDNDLSFSALSSATSEFNIQKNPEFKWDGAGQQLFSSGQQPTDKSAEVDAYANNTGDEYDPHYEPIVPLPEEIVVTTGEEDEEKIFGQRCKLYRYDDSREWKERGVGELKILYHPQRNTYRLLLRREQVFKAVLNMLLFKDLELHPMKNSDSAWTWVGRNYAESVAGDQELLAVRFKNADLANAFRDKVVECVRKLQAAAAQAIRDNEIQKAPSLRVPKLFAESSRADADVTARAEQLTAPANAANEQTASQTVPIPTTTIAVQGQSDDGHQDGGSQTLSIEPEEYEYHEHDEPADDDDEEYEHDYDHNEDYDDYEEEDESTAFYSCSGRAVVRDAGADGARDQRECEEAHVQVIFDQEFCSPKILLTDAATGEILADMLIHTDTEFQLVGYECSWAGFDYTTHQPTNKTVTVAFPDVDTAMQFYDSCETSKAATTYTSTDPES